MRFKMIDGTEYSGRSYDEVVAAMADAKLTEVKSIEGYRRETARRVSGMYEKVIDASTSEAFIKSLVSAELMEKVS